VGREEEEEKRRRVGYHAGRADFVVLIRYSVFFSLPPQLL